MSDMECPYCGADQEVNHDDGCGFEEDKLHEQQCSECDKYFVFTTYISFSYNPHKADCLNGSAHDYKPTHTYPKEYTKMECSCCGDRRKPTPEEYQSIMEK
jgi:hypothetical protein